MKLATLTSITDGQAPADGHTPTGTHHTPLSTIPNMQLSCSALTSVQSASVVPLVPLDIPVRQRSCFPCAVHPASIHRPGSICAIHGPHRGSQRTSDLPAHLVSASSGPRAVEQACRQALPCRHYRRAPHVRRQLASSRASSRCAARLPGRAQGRCRPAGQRRIAASHL